MSDARKQLGTIENRTEQHGRAKHSFYRWVA
jgi:hypothetical protein